MPESVCLSLILGNALGRSLLLSSNSSWCICLTDPCGSRRKPSADKRNFVVVRTPPAGLVLRVGFSTSIGRSLLARLSVPILELPVCPLIRQKSKSLCLAHVTAMQPAEEPEADGY